VRIGEADHRRAVLDRVEHPTAHRLGLAAVPVERELLDLSFLARDEALEDRLGGVGRTVIDEEETNSGRACEIEQATGIDPLLFIVAGDDDYDVLHNAHQLRPGASIPRSASRCETRLSTASAVPTARVANGPPRHAASEAIATGCRVAERTTSPNFDT